jgi:hypothetical protein
VRGKIGTVIFIAVAAAWVLLGQFYYPTHGHYEGADKETNNVAHAEKADDRIARYTFWLAILTGALSVSTLLLWRVTKKSAEIAERALTELERPFVGIEIENTGFTVKDAKTDPYVMLDRDLTFKFANYGRTPATITEMFDKFYVCEPGEMPPPVSPTQGNKFPFGVIIGANERSASSTRSPSKGIDPNLWQTFSTGENALFLIGFVRFQDIFGKFHVTGFCLKFNKGDARFLFEGDKRYNYTREDKT